MAGEFSVCCVRDSQRHTGEDQGERRSQTRVVTFHGVVDRNGGGLGAKRNVAGDHQRGSEISQ